MRVFTTLPHVAIIITCSALAVSAQTNTPSANGAGPTNISTPRRYLMFFDSNDPHRGDLVNKIIDIAAKNALADIRRGVVHKIEVNGYYDTSVPTDEALTLSNASASEVADRLVYDGIPRYIIITHGFGWAHPMVPTGPNVREPQNRRVSIELK